MSTRIGVLGTKFNTLAFIKNMNIQFEISALISLDTDEASASKIAGYSRDRLAQASMAKGIKFYTVTNYQLKDNDSLNLFKKLELDLLFVMGWERLVPDKILAELKIGAFGMHGSMHGLPMGKGRSPLNWALITGGKEFHTSLFKYENNIDGGDIYDTESFDVLDSDSISDLHLKNLRAMINLTNKLTFEISQENNVNFKPQNSQGETFYPKRIPDDGDLDWNASSVLVTRFINALSKPYPLARTKTSCGKTIKLYDAKVFYSAKYSSPCPGLVIEVLDLERALIVGTSDGAIIVKTDDNLFNINPGTRFSSVCYNQTLQKIIHRHQLQNPSQKLENLNRL